MSSPQKATIQVAENAFSSTGRYGRKKLTGTGVHSAPTGYVFYAVQAKTSDATIGASCAKHSDNQGDALASGDTITAGDPPEIIGWHDDLQFSTNADYVLAWLEKVPS